MAIPIIMIVRRREIPCGLTGKLRKTAVQPSDYHGGPGTHNGSYEVSGLICRWRKRAPDRKTPIWREIYTLERGVAVKKNHERDCGQRGKYSDDGGEMEAAGEFRGTGMFRIRVTHPGSQCGGNCGYKMEANDTTKIRSGQSEYVRVASDIYYWPFYLDFSWYFQQLYNQRFNDFLYSSVSKR